MFTRRAKTIAPSLAASVSQEAEAAETAVYFDRVCKRYSEAWVLREMTFAVAAGEVVTLIGRSGAGKSTILRCVNQLEQIESGNVYVDGELAGCRVSGNRLVALHKSKIVQQRRHTGMVFQNFELFPHLSAVQNVMLGLQCVNRQSAEDARTHARKLLEDVGLRAQEDSYPTQMSGGQQQRVAIARALATSPSILLFDEPTSALDPQLVGEVLEVIRSLAGTGITMLIATHEMSFARDISDRVMFVQDGQVLESGPPSQIFGAPEHEETSDFLSRIVM